MYYFCYIDVIVNLEIQTCYKAIVYIDVAYWLKFNSWNVIGGHFFSFNIISNTLMLFAVPDLNNLTPTVYIYLI